MRSASSRHILPLLALVLAACGGGPDKRSDDDGLVRPIVRIPYDDVVPDGLRRPSRATATAGGWLCIADSGNGRAVVLKDMQRVAILGSPGQAPGEFEKVDACAVTTDGATVLAIDSALQRLTVFEMSSGSVLTSHAADTSFNSWSALSAHGDIATVDAALTQLTVANPITGALDITALPHDHPCLSDSRAMPGIAARMAISEEGGRVAIALAAHCAEDESQSMLLDIDLVTKAHRIVPLSVRVRPGEAQGGRVGRTTRTLTMGGIALTPTGIVLVHAGSSTVDGHPATTVDLVSFDSPDSARRQISNSAPVIVPAPVVTVSDGRELVIVNGRDESILAYSIEELRGAGAPREVAQ